MSSWRVILINSWEQKRIYPMEEQFVPCCLQQHLRTAFINKALKDYYTRMWVENVSDMNRLVVFSAPGWLKVKWRRKTYDDDPNTPWGTCCAAHHLDLFFFFNSRISRSFVFIRKSGKDSEISAVFNYFSQGGSKPDFQNNANKLALQSKMLLSYHV